VNREDCLDNERMAKAGMTYFTRNRIVNAARNFSNAIRGCSWDRFTPEEKLAIAEMLDDLARIQRPVDQPRQILGSKP